MVNENNKNVKTIENKDRILRLSNNTDIILNDEQYDVINIIREWLNERKEYFFTLAGYSGTGKSTIIKKIINEYKYKRNIAVSATTHKAKKVIMRYTAMNGLTIHSILGLRPDLDLDDFDPNDPKFNQIAIPTMSKFDFIIIDESSMINSELFDLIKTEIKKHRLVQILFIGDPAQIPPVNEKRSTVFFDPHIKKYELKQIMRQQDGNPLLDFYDKIRNNLTKLNSGIIRKTTINEKGEGVYFYNERKAFREIVLPLFNSQEAKDDIDYIKLLAWRNITVKDSNSIIRNYLFGNNANYIEKGDIIMGYRSITDRYNEYNIIENSADYRITDVFSYDENEYGLKGFFVIISEPIDNKHNSYEKIFVVDHTDQDNLNNYGEIHDLLVIDAKKNKKKWKNYYSFRRENILMTPILHYRDGSNRPAGSRIIKDIDYGYAITTHKAQGSTYTKVVILENDINANPIIKERNQIKYVAFTRPTHSAIVLSRLTVK